MKISMRIPMDVDDQVEFQNPAAITQMAQAMEKAGVDACYITEHPIPTTEWRRPNGHDALDPFAALAFVAAVTTKLRLHTNLVVLPYKNPFITAKSVASVDVLSAGRLILGVGVGYLKGEYDALGVDFASRGFLMDQALKAMKVAWAEEDVVFEGRGFKAVGNIARPRPIQQPHPPIWGGGNSDRAVRRAAELCDGWSPFFAAKAMSERAGTDEMTTLEDLKAKLDKLRGFLDGAGRTRPFDVNISPPKGMQALTTSEANRYAEDVAKLAEMGVNWTSCGVPQPSRQAFLDNIQWVGEEVLPKLHAITPRPLR